MKTKKLMLLGGIRYLIPIIEKAHELGLYVITCDYLPDNPAHKYSDQYVNVSIIDKEAVFAVAVSLEIDGIMSFGCDPGVVTAAYVAERMKLPFQCSYSSAIILQNKNLFKKFLKDNGFNTPKSISFSSYDDAVHAENQIEYPVIVKPVDSAGSKGVTKVSSAFEYKNALRYAFDNSFSKTVIVEEFLDVMGYQSSTDMFTVNGQLVNPLFSDQYFDDSAANPFVPIMEVWPTTMSQEHQKYLVSELNRLFALLECRNGIYNVECRVCSNGKAYIMEVSPRGGGNHIALAQDITYGLNFIENEIRNAVGIPVVIKDNDDIDDINDINYIDCIDGVYCIYTIHSKGKIGQFENLTLSHDIEKKIKFFDLGIEKGNMISQLSGAHQAIGDIILHFTSRQELESYVFDTSKWLSIDTI